MLSGAKGVQIKGSQGDSPMPRKPGLPRRWPYVVSAAAGATALGLVTTFLPTARAQEPITVERLSSGAPASFADLIERVSPAVVSVNVTVEVDGSLPGQFNFDGAPPGFEEFFRQFRRDFDEPEPREGRALGSGFLISPDGYIVTNNHVVNNATKVMVTLHGDDELEAEIVGVDVSTDLAVLKVTSDEPLPYVEFAEGEPVRVGDWVVAVGNPFGLGGTATAGIISASGREIGGQYNDFLQIDAPINRGNSGGPTFNLEGRVVGVNSQIFSPSGGNVGIGFAIPARTASRVVNAIVSEGRVVRGWLGVTIEPVTADIAESLGLEEARGAIVNNVMADSPAESAGFRVGDVVLTVGGERVESSLDLTRKVGDLVVGEQVRFRIYRDGRERNINVTIGERPSDDDLAAMREAPSTASPGVKGSEFGLGLSSLDDETRERLGLDRGVNGVVVRSAATGGEAAEKGLREGDVILEVAGDAVSTPAEFEAAVAAARRADRTAVLLLVQTDQGRRFVALSLTGNG
jgi:serine protease Do